MFRTKHTRRHSSSTHTHTSNSFYSIRTRATAFSWTSPRGLTLILISLSLLTLTAIYLNPFRSQALPTGLQQPATESTISVNADGAAPFDGSTGSGLDENNSNGFVRNFDSIIYDVEFTMNDADDTNAVAVITLNDKATWKALPSQYLY